MEGDDSGRKEKDVRIVGLQVRGTLTVTVEGCIADKAVLGQAAMVSVR